MYMLTFRLKSLVIELSKNVYNYNNMGAWQIEKEVDLQNERKH